MPTRPVNRKPDPGEQRGIRVKRLVERRADSAYAELQLAHRYDWVIPNHDGEDSENWNAFYYPVGDALKTLHAVVDLLEDRAPTGAEAWDDALVP